MKSFAFAPGLCGFSGSLICSGPYGFPVGQTIHALILRWLGLPEQRFRLAKWSVCRG